MNRQITLDDIRTKVEQLALKLPIKPRSTLFPTYGFVNESSPGIMIDANNKFHYVLIDRGQETERKITTDIDELQYWIFAGIIFWLALDFEKANRIESQDFRRMWFNKQEELLGLLSPIWQLKCRSEHLNILERSPFDDNSAIRAHYCKELQDKSLDYSDAWHKACVKYPLPKT